MALLLETGASASSTFKATFQSFLLLTFLLFDFLQRGILLEKGIELMINGFCQEVFNNLPLEFATEADKLLSLKLEGNVG